MGKYVKHHTFIAITFNLECFEKGYARLKICPNKLKFDMILADFALDA